MSSEAAKRATAKYQREKMESISIRVKRSEGISDQIKQAATVQGIKPAQFIKQAIQNAIRAKLDGPQPVQTQPQPYTTPATGDNVLLIEYPPDKLFNERIRVLIDAGITPGVSEYIGPILFDELDSELSYNGVSLWRYEHGTTDPRHK